MQSIFRKPANVITASRFPLSVALACLFPFDSLTARISLLVIVLAIIISDRIDGIVARRSGSASVEGSILDSMADNFTMISGSVSLYSKGFIPLWLLLFGLWVRSLMTLVRLLTAVRGETYAGSRLSTRLKGAAYGFGLLYFVIIYSLSDVFILPNQLIIDKVVVGILGLLTGIAALDFFFVNRQTVFSLFIEVGHTHDH